MSDYYDRAGNPITNAEWLSNYSKKDRRVASTTLPGGYLVSTVWLGLNHQYGDGLPLIFETMVFPCDAAGKVTSWGELDAARYSTEADAIAGHERIVGEFKTRPSTRTDADVEDDHRAIAEESGR